MCPIFQVSNVEGTNLPLLRQFLNIVPLRRQLNENDPAHFQVAPKKVVPYPYNFRSMTFTGSTVLEQLPVELCSLELFVSMIFSFLDQLPTVISCRFRLNRFIVNECLLELSSVDSLHRLRSSEQFFLN